MNTSQPRTFSSICTATSPSEKHDTVALPIAVFRYPATSLASAGLALPVKTFNRVSAMDCCIRFGLMRAYSARTAGAAEWLGRQDSNLRYTGSKPDALPLGYAPVETGHFIRFEPCLPAASEPAGLLKPAAQGIKTRCLTAWLRPSRNWSFYPVRILPSSSIRTCG